ncbi:cytochrome P450 [Chiua virens]|nr:cytochrome P450 [Chiua virens]
MNSRLLDLSVGIPGYAVAGIAAALVVVIKLSQPSKLDAIPTVGSGALFGSWWDALTHLSSGLDLVQEGYKKYKAKAFKVARFDQWVVIISSRELVDEIRRAPDDTLSFLEGVNDAIQVTHTLGHEIHHNPYHIPIVRSRLTRNIGSLYPEITNEIITAFDDVFALNGNDWKNVPVVSSMQAIICRTSNRVFVGLPLCRDPDWVDLNIQYTLNVVMGGALAKMFPESLRGLAMRLFTKLNQAKQRGRKLLGPVIKERQQRLSEYGDQWTDKPNDFLSWLMEEAEGPESTMEFLTNRILTLNFAAIHSFAHVILYLAGNPEYIQPLREEVEAIVETEGWTKAALGKMRKVDSFLKECQRLEGINGVGLVRKVLKDFAFSDGTVVPKGATVGAANWCIHRDEAFYKNPFAFEPFRFADLREEDGESVRHQFVSASPEYLPFGLGRHACPGRFFAANEMKSMLAHLVVTYDIKFEDGTTRPPTIQFGTVPVPSPTAKMMIRKRVH